MGYVSIILNIILGIWGIYLYLENRKLKGFKVERDIKLKQLQLIELENEDSKHFGGWDIFYIQEYEVKINKIKAEIDYLEKLRKYKWLFGK